jgi:ankyrin repeat protein
MVEQLNAVFVDLLAASKGFNEAKKGSKLAVGFNRTNKDGDTCLFAALKEQNTSAALLMINSQMLDVTSRKEKSNLTALHLIASLVTDETTLREIFRKLDPSKLLTEDRNGNTPLHYAAYSRNMAMVNLLFQHVPNCK